MPGFDPAARANLLARMMQAQGPQYGQGRAGFGPGGGATSMARTPQSPRMAIFGQGAPSANPSHATGAMSYPQGMRSAMPATPFTPTDINMQQIGKGLDGRLPYTPPQMGYPSPPLAGTPTQLPQSTMFPVGTDRPQAPSGPSIAPTMRPPAPTMNGRPPVVAPQGSAYKTPFPPQMTPFPPEMTPFPPETMAQEPQFTKASMFTDKNTFQTKPSMIGEPNTFQTPARSPGFAAGLKGMGAGLLKGMGLMEGLDQTFTSKGSALHPGIGDGTLSGNADFDRETPSMFGDKTLGGFASSLDARLRNPAAMTEMGATPQVPMTPGIRNQMISPGSLFDDAEEPNQSMMPPAANYNVQKGDTLTGIIASKLGIDPTSEEAQRLAAGIAGGNKFHPDKLEIGQTIDFANFDGAAYASARIGKGAMPKRDFDRQQTDGIASGLTAAMNSPEFQAMLNDPLPNPYPPPPARGMGRGF